MRNTPDYESDGLLKEVLAQICPRADIQGLAEKLAVMDKWGKLLTIAAIVYVIVAALYLFQVWTLASPIVGM